MAEQLFGLTKGQAQRIGRLVQANERHTPPQLRQRSGTSTPDQTFWAELTAEDSANPGQYKWKKIEIDDREFVDVSPAVTSGTAYSAIEPNQTPGLSGNKVSLAFYGFDDAGSPRYIIHAPPSAGPVWIKITSYATITGRDNAWRYSWTEQELVHNGVWQDKSGGRSSAADGYAYNSVEANNSDSGMQGNSIDIDSLPGTITIQPVQGEPVVQAWPIVNCDGDTEWLFAYENAIGGSCS